MRSLIFFLSTFCALNVSAAIAFQKQIGDQRLIVVADDQGLNQRVISDPSLDTYHPEMSSSGQYVAYTRGKIRPGVEVENELVVKDLNTGDSEVWTPKGNQYIHAEFSGNDRFLVFSGVNEKNDRQNIMIIDLKKEREKGADQVTINSDGTLTYNYKPELEIIESQYDCYAPAVASDGSFVLYHRTLDKSDKSSPKQLVQYFRGNKTVKELTLAS
ncbi:MAG: hypothetical protein HRT44_11310, partial [Bdellovibrionales bacterium]|nr:hypothetical protein [Bdellovibrionales bacterium]NQZ19829.1 hypothetical protein [Bdellovibrionales bacterium]